MGAVSRFRGHPVPRITRSFVCVPVADPAPHLHALALALDLEPAFEAVIGWIVTAASDNLQRNNGTLNRKVRPHATSLPCLDAPYQPDSSCAS